MYENISNTFAQILNQYRPTAIQQRDNNIKEHAGPKTRRMHQGKRSGTGILPADVQSLENKLEYLRTRIKHQRDRKTVTSSASQKHGGLQRQFCLEVFLHDARQAMQNNGQDLSPGNV